MTLCNSEMFDLNVIFRDGIDGSSHLIKRILLEEIADANGEFKGTKIEGKSVSFKTGMHFYNKVCNLDIMIIVQPFNFNRLDSLGAMV